MEDNPLFAGSSNPLFGGGSYFNTTLNTSTTAAADEISESLNNARENRKRRINWDQLLSFLPGVIGIATGAISTANANTYAAAPPEKKDYTLWYVIGGLIFLAIIVFLIIKLKRK